MSIPTDPPEAASDRPLSPLSTNVLLFLVSVAGLFLELLLIRWIGSEWGLFAFLQNAVLLLFFLGMGMGCWTCRQPAEPRRIFWPFLLLVLLVITLGMGLGLTKGSALLRIHLVGSAEWLTHDGKSAGEWAVLLVPLGLELVLLITAMALLWQLALPLGRLVGRLMEAHPRVIFAYSVNIAGSLLGIWLFVLLSVWYQPPVIWFLVATGLLLLIAAGLGALRGFDLLLAAGVIGLTWSAGRPGDALEVWWSPYQKLTLELPTGKDHYTAVGEFIVRVNNDPYQGMLDLSPAHVRDHPDRFPPDLEGLSQYDLPFRMHPRPERVLVVGAGTGNDVAGARRHGVRHITAVDIDPAIVQLGRRYHPERPYREDGTVRVLVDDARSFFAACRERFDLIVFGLLDAPIQAGNASIHLDNFVYTRESLEAARSLLAEDGVLVMTFEVLRPFIPERIRRTLSEVYGHEPFTFYIPMSGYGWGGVMYVIAENQERIPTHIAADPRLAAKVAEWQAGRTFPRPENLALLSDDWPYLYLESPRVPVPHLVFAALVLLLFWFGTRRLEIPGFVRGWEAAQWHFFLLGAAFMLLEVQNISKAAIVLGSTWWVNAVIISGILVFILLANVTAAWFPKLPPGPVYVLLIGSCLFLYTFDLARLGPLPFALKATLLGLLTGLPMFFSGIVFIRSFAEVRTKGQALGANLFGSLAGGLLQMMTFLTGISALLLVVAGLYLAALLARSLGKGRGPAVTVS